MISTINSKKEPIIFSNNDSSNLASFGKLLNNNKRPTQPQPSYQPKYQSQQQPPYPPKYPPQQQFPKRDSYEDIQRLKNIESSGDRYCLDDSQECRLTKKQMCEKITYHFIVVNNLIATIVSVVPLPNENGTYSGGLMFERMQSLRKGVFCVPPHHSEIMSISEDERLHQILKFINILPKDNLSFEETCKRSGGFVLKLKKERMDELGKDEKFGRKYFEFLKKINLSYQEALINLYNILENLQNNQSISTRRLNEMSSKTKQIIDELYLKTQFNYLLAILVILDFDFAKTTKETSEKVKRMQYIISH